MKAAESIALVAARARVELARLDLVRQIDELPDLGGDKRVSTSEVDVALHDLKAAKDALELLEAHVVI
jgi:hypothetical protein